MEKETFKISDKQFEFLRKLRVELNPLDDMADSILVKVLTDREYDKFQRIIIRDLRARWIRENGLHNRMIDGRMKYEDEINRIDRL